MNFMMFNNYFLIFYWICSISPVYGLYNFLTKCFYKRFLSSNTLRHIVFVTIPAEIDSAHSYSIFCLTSSCGLNSPLQVCSSVSHAYNIHHSWILSSIINYKVMLGKVICTFIVHSYICLINQCTRINVYRLRQFDLQQKLITIIKNK